MDSLLNTDVFKLINDRLNVKLDHVIDIIVEKIINLIERWKNNPKIMALIWHILFISFRL